MDSTSGDTHFCMYDNDLLVADVHEKVLKKRKAKI